MVSSRTISLPPGFEDRDPATVAQEQRLIRSFFHHSALYGFRPIYLSPVSFNETFLGQNAKASEWVYTFLDKAGRELILNPDSLPSVLRCFANRSDQSTSSVRLSFSAP